MALKLQKQFLEDEMISLPTTLLFMKLGQQGIWASTRKPCHGLQRILDETLKICQIHYSWTLTTWKLYFQEN